jgi:hypothetical protein
VELWLSGVSLDFHQSDEVLSRDDVGESGKEEKGAGYSRAKVELGGIEGM